MSLYLAWTDGDGYRSDFNSEAAFIDTTYWSGISSLLFGAISVLLDT